MVGGNGLNDALHSVLRKQDRLIWLARILLRQFRNRRKEPAVENRLRELEMKMAVIEREMERQSEAAEKTSSAVEKMGDIIAELKGDFKGLTAKAAVYLAILGGLMAVVGPLIAKRLWGE